MEEKLYFQPENYGSDKKKEHKEPKKKSEKKDHRVLKLLGFLLFLLIIILIIIWLLRGKTVISGNYPENVRNESLTCTATALTPPKIDSIDSTSKELKINAIFKETSELKSISFVYTLQYSSDDEAYKAEAKSHAFFNKALAASGYSVSKFNNKFARYDDRLIISLYAEKNTIDPISAPYFMIALNDDGEVGLESIEDFRKNYEAQGFICASTTENEN